jgi:FtsP/CotA-like multicopper oxidase with cupredoxin domain
MTLGKASILVFVLAAMLTTLFMVKMSQGEAAPANPTDNSKVPHYFGPWPNWALSPLTLPAASVVVTDTAGVGTGATATAAVGANGAVTGITVVTPGSGYMPGTVQVSIQGAGTLATASAVVTTTGNVTAVTVGAQGGGYTSPVVTITGGGATTDATAIAYGGVDAITLANAGSGYTMPTVDFDAPDDPNGVDAKAHAEWNLETGAITAIILDEPGSGYATAPNIIIRDGTVMDPIRDNPGVGASATATLKILSVALDTFGAGYTSPPTVTISDGIGAGAGATATAAVDTGGVTAINVTAPGSGYVTGGGIKKFQDDLPGLCDPHVPGSCPADWIVFDTTTPPEVATLTKAVPLGVPVARPYDDPNGDPIIADEYEIGLVQYRIKFNSDLPATLVRGYVQLETPAFVAAHPGVSRHYALTNEWQDGTKMPVLQRDGSRWFAVTPPQWLGPTIAAQKNKPVRIVFHNLLPRGAAGDLFLPVDGSIMGSGMGPSMDVPAPIDEGTVMDGIRNPVCAQDPKPVNCFKDPRATLHLHGGTTPWISDGTPHQWITPADEDTPWPEGVAVENVPDMAVGNDPRDGIQTFYYTNQQSARLLFYHDHAWGITRLNVYAGEAAGYLIGDETEARLVSSGTIPAAGDTIPLVVQDRTFVPQDSQLYDSVDASGTVTSYGQDPTWDKTRWGDYGDFWYHHVYMPAQNPGDAGGMSAYGRWMYGPWFWPPAAPKYGPIANPYYDSACHVDDPTTWTYQVDPFCEPLEIPGTPNISAGMEQFNDTPIVNGVAYPEVTLQPKTYRFRMLNAANDRFMNFQWYIADPSTGTLSEVALNPQELAAAQTDPNVFPTPVQGAATAGPDWIQIGSEGGFLPTPAVVDGQQPTTWITDPTRFDVGNVDLHSLLLSPAERADVIVDFSRFAGKTLILYNDAPAAFPARVPSYDYYTGGPDLSPNGAPTILPGYGPNTRTIMRVTIANNTPATAFDLNKLKNAFRHKADGSGVFESGQHPIIVGQAAYNAAYGTSFVGTGNCNPIPNDPNPAFQICDGLVRINDTMTFGFNTLKKPNLKTMMPVQPKAIHDEMNATTFDEFGRMQANLGVEAMPPTPGIQNGTFYPYVNPATELLNGTDLPKNAVTWDANGQPVSDVKITPISNANDGSQIWRITHNGVDTHPIHFHLYDVQMLNRVTWDNIVIPTEPGELGWKETIRVAPLEDTIVALRPIIPEVPWEVPNAIHNLNPMDPTGSTALFNNVDMQGIPTVPITNKLVNFGWEYVWHCHILSHEEMDMMRPQTLAMPPVKPDGLAYTLTGAGASQRAVLTWEDNSITETAFVVQRSADLGATWINVGTITSPLDEVNGHGPRTFTDPSPFDPATTVRYYRISAQNTVGYGSAFPSMTVESTSTPSVVGTAYTITASAGANGSISPTGVVTVGGGGSQTFTITPNTGYRRLEVLVDGVNVPAAVTSGTYTFTGVAADHTISATFTLAAVSITATSGANGTVTPAGVTNVAIGGNLTYTITPNAGYSRATVLVDGVNVPASVTSGTYVFTGVTVNHTISATFAANPPTITVTAPSAGGSYAQLTNLPVTWTTNAPVNSGQFAVWAVSPTGWYIGKLVPQNGTASYSTSVTLNVPTGSGYAIRVGWRPIAGSGAWTAFGVSSGTFTVTAPSFTTISVPSVTGTYAQLTNLPVTWTTNAPVSSGEFAVWAVSPTGWFIGKLVPQNGTASYATSVNLNVPTGSGYTIRVGYRPTPGSGAWTIFGSSSGTFTVTAAGGLTTITVPAVTGTYAPSFSLPVTWTTNAAVSSGEFAVWAVSPTGWFIGKLVPQNGTASYATNVTLNVPTGSGYAVRVGYRPTLGSGAWTNFGASSGTFTVN